MIRFPETARIEWQLVADAANAEHEVRKRIQRATKVEAEMERLRTRHEANLLFQQEIDADLTPDLEMTTLADHQSNPAAAPSDLIEGVLKDDGVCIVLGPGGAGKSTVALQVFYSLMTGTEWLGQRVEQINGAVGAISYDMDGALMFDWMKGFPGIDATKVSVVNAYKRGNPLNVPLMRERIAAEWKRINVEVVLIDSFSASFFGSDENDAAATRHHYRDLIKFALTEVGARAVMIVAHSTEANPFRPRGSTVHIDVADSIMAVVPDKKGVRTYQMLKYRAGIGQRMMDPIMVSEPDSVTHLVSLDTGQMALAGMKVPGAAVFAPLPDAHAAPDTDSDSPDEDDDL